jgi:hypothetical protein
LNIVLACDPKKGVGAANAADRIKGLKIAIHYGSCSGWQSRKMALPGVETSQETLPSPSLNSNRFLVYINDSLSASDNTFCLSFRTCLVLNPSRSREVTPSFCRETGHDSAESPPAAQQCKP